MKEKKMKTRILAMHLPQFHEIPENNKWWGEGFTEWTNVKKAIPLYEGHLQPRVPLNQNYYDLSEEKSLIGQMELSREYGVDGFCFYHYWFKGKKLLEKPVEMLLKVENPPIEYCLCWANEPWTRTWDGNLGAKQILMEQDYGDEADWKEHFAYLEQFFRQEKYIKVEGKPVIIIYKSSDILRCKEMVGLWKKLATQAGYPGLFVINVHRQRLHNEIPFYGDGVLNFEPFATMSNMSMLDHSKMRRPYPGSREDNEDYLYEVWDYDQFCQVMTNRYTFSKQNHYLGMFVGWDNTPRRGIDTKLIFEGNTPEAFEKHFRKQYETSLALENDFLFINAWNEWAEGTFLEPCERYQYGYLEAIKKVRHELRGEKK